MKRILLILSLACFCSLAASAQYAIDWFTIDGGGGTSTGGGYCVSGMVSLPDPGAFKISRACAMNEKSC